MYKLDQTRQFQELICNVQTNTIRRNGGSKVQDDLH